ncbi:uncharacterized protein LOC111914393 isoform X2 [Lactuca sativa]|uniref:uncharacterized protein LOC111914393 isoform X2 n=1 Tax=Lactuca sativa TaxID=4236 RepID=UPI000CD9AFBD|nr:uncharacterized protein LOC111914393 isoform X2 [Lactuca sativa]
MISRLKSWFLLLKTQRIGPKFFSTISESERSFKLIQSNFQESSFTTASMLKGSKSTRYGAHFTRDGLDTTMSNGHLTMKKEKTLPHIMRSHTILAVKTPGSKKRKNMRSIELSLENLGVEDALQKLASFSQAVRINIPFHLYFFYFIPLTSFFLQFSKRVSAELRARAERAEQVLKEQDKISRAIKKDLLKRVELLSK